MALESRLELRLSQKLILTPQLQQAIKLLQLPQLELTQAINQELMENPFLEESAEDSEQDKNVSEKEENINLFEHDDTEKPLDAFTRFHVDEYFDERSTDGRDLGYFTPDVESKPSYEAFLSKKPELIDHLIWQLRVLNVEDNVKEVAEMIIGNIDENGYLRATEEELADVLDVDISIIKKVLSLVQSFDPHGIAARNLKECLLIQLRMLNLQGTLVEDIIQNNLEYLEKKKYQSLAKQYECSIKEILAAIEIIEGLEPKPGRNYSGNQISYIVPDVFIEKTGDNYRIILNDDNVPRVRLNRKYRELLKNKKSLDKSEKDMLVDKYAAAKSLIRSLDERNKTIYRVTESILNSQRGFFEGGVQFLKPLNLKDISNDINMHESNISRVTSKKYISCSHGVFPFRFFFSSSLPGGEGSVSSTTVKAIIKKIIDEEDKRKPLTDSKIIELLKSEGIKIARRTLAKYREELKILPYTRRRKIEY